MIRYCLHNGDVSFSKKEDSYVFFSPFLVSFSCRMRRAFLFDNMIALKQRRLSILNLNNIGEHFKAQYSVLFYNILKSFLLTLLIFNFTPRIIFDVSFNLTEYLRFQQSSFKLFDLLKQSFGLLQTAFNILGFQEEKTLLASITTNKTFLHIRM